MPQLIRAGVVLSQDKTKEAETHKNRDSEEAEYSEIIAGSM